MNELHIVMAQINSTVGAISENAARIRQAVSMVPARTDMVIFPEMCLSGYPLADLVNRADLLTACRTHLAQLTKDLADAPAILLGCPHVDTAAQGEFLDRTYLDQVGDCAEKGKIFNAIMLLQNGTCHWVSSKFHLPNEGIFDEKRQFAQPHHHAGPTEIAGVRFGIMVCHDMWFADVAETMQESGAEILVAPNASPFEWDKQQARQQACLNRVVETQLPFIMVNQVGAQDGVVFDGASFVLERDCRQSVTMPDFRESLYHTRWEKKTQGWTCVEHAALWGGDDLLASSSDWPAMPMLPRAQQGEKAWDSAYQAIGLGLRDFMRKSGLQRVVLGLSGGVDSALVATIARDFLGPEHVCAVLLPSPYTAQQSLDDAQALARRQGIITSIIAINDLMQGYQQALKPALPEGLEGVAAENIQARIRGNVLMAMANQSGALLLTTGNKSEIAVGYCTLYGDMCGGFNPIADLYKTEVYALCRWRNQALDSTLQQPVIPPEILARPPSAELAPDQRDDDTLPDYAVLDAILFAIIEQNSPIESIVAQGYDKNLVKRVMRLLDHAQHKRTQSAIGVKISRHTLKSQWRYPINNSFAKEI